MNGDRQALLLDSTTPNTWRTLQSLLGWSCKRIVDFALAATALIVTAPLMMIIAAVLWLESPGHVIFAQKRLGRFGKRFMMYKFRKFPADYRDGGPAVTVANDARLTKFGVVLERMKLDELPQLWNIIKGDMSLVGPRPETPEFADLFVDPYRALLQYWPGLFGPNQSHFRNESSLYPADEHPETYYRTILFPQKVERDLAYFQTANCFTDLIWIVKGVWAVIAGAIDWKCIIKAHGLTISVDLLVVAIAWTLVNLFRFSGLPEGADLQGFVVGLWMFPPLLVGAAFVGRCYLYPIQHFSLEDGLRLLATFSIAWPTSFLLLVGITRHVSLYLAPIGWFVLLPLLLLARIGLSMRERNSPSTKQGKSLRVLVYGSEAGGIGLAHWMKLTSVGITVLGFLDDNPERRGQLVHGTPILGGEKDVPTVHSVYGVHEIWLTFRPGEAKRHRLSALCEAHGLRLVVFSDLEPFRRLKWSKA